MPYSIETRDGIVIDNIPDDVDRNSAELKARVVKARQQRTQQEYDPAAGMSTGEKFLAGMGKSFVDVGRTARRLIPGSGYGAAEAQADEAMDRPLMRTGAGQLGNFAGDVALTALPAAGIAGRTAAGVRGAASMLPRAAGALTTAAPYIGAATAGAVTGAATSPEDLGTGAGMGAVGGAGGEFAGRALARTMGGLIRPSQQAQTLMQQGVQPTIGQAADQTTLTGRAIRRAEDISESVPLVGGIVRNARNRASKEFGQTAFDRAIAPGGVSQPVSREGVDALGKQFKQAYGVLDNYTFAPDRQFEQDILNIVSDPNYRANRDTVDGVLKFFENNFTKKFQQGPQNVGAFLSGDGFKAFDSEIGRRIRDLAGQQGQEALAERRILTAIDGALQQYRNRQLPPAVVEQLTDTDRAYAAWKRIARASKYSDSGEVTPAQLTRAVKAMSQGDSYGRGQAFMQDLTDPAAILRNRMPNSGTADRVAGMALAGATLNNPAAFAPYAAGAIGLGGLYARPTQRFLLGGYGPQQAMADFLRRRPTSVLRAAGAQANSDEE